MNPLLSLSSAITDAIVVYDKTVLNKLVAYIFEARRGTIVPLDRHQLTSSWTSSLNTSTGPDLRYMQSIAYPGRIKTQISHGYSPKTTFTIILLPPFRGVLRSYDLVVLFVTRKDQCQSIS